MYWLSFVLSHFVVLSSDVDGNDVHNVQESDKEKTDNRQSHSRGKKSTKASPKKNVTISDELSVFLFCGHFCSL